MSYTVTLKSKKQYSLSDDNANSLKTALKNPKTMLVELNTDLVKTYEITSITKDNLSEADKPLRPDRTLETNRCKAQYSIQREINNIIFSEGEGSSNRIKNESYREQIRKQLRLSPAVEWCDYKANECACEK